MSKPDNNVKVGPRRYKPPVPNTRKVASQAPAIYGGNRTIILTDAANERLFQARITCSRLAGERGRNMQYKVTSTFQYVSGTEFTVPVSPCPLSTMNEPHFKLKLRRWSNGGRFVLPPLCSDPLLSLSSRIHALNA
jgi:hypothetical protein